MLCTDVDTAIDFATKGQANESNNLHTCYACRRLSVLLTDVDAAIGQQVNCLLFLLLLSLLIAMTGQKEESEPIHLFKDMLVTLLTSYGKWYCYVLLPLKEISAAHLLEVTLKLTFIATCLSLLYLDWLPARI